jgi:hypothetical protein
MSSTAQTYRVYFFDSVHKVLTSDLIEAASDEDAVATAQKAGFGTQCEIWQGRRLIAELGERKTA